MDSIELQLCERIRSSETHQTAVTFLDFIISGKSIYGELISRNFDYVSCLGWVGNDYELEARDRLHLKAPGEMSKDRVGIYVCPECVDPYCGAITTKITEEDGVIIWSEFAYDNFMEGDPEMFIFKYLEGLGPYKFNKIEYFNALSSKI